MQNSSRSNDVTNLPTGSSLILEKIFILIQCFSCSGNHMKKETIVIIGAVVLLDAVIIAIGVAIGYSNPWDQSDSRPYSGNMMGQGMMSSRITGSGNLMNQGMMGSGMMGGMGMMALYRADAKPISETDARNQAQAYTNRYYPGAKIGDFMEFSLNYYVQLKDTSNTSIAEILVDRYTGVVTPEPGPNMIWNTLNRGQRSTTSVVYDMGAAKSQAEKFLAGYLPDATIQESTSYPGYYTFDFGREKIEGMLSVNAYTGDIWVHTWHGQFIRD